MNITWAEYRQKNENKTPNTRISHSKQPHTQAQRLQPSDRIDYDCIEAEQTSQQTRDNDLGLD